MNREKIICTMLCVIALIGFILPAVNINIDFLGNTRSMSLSARSLFDRPDTPLDDLESSRFSQLDLSDMSSGIVAEIRTEVIASVGAYFIALVLLILLLVLAIIGKFKKTSILISAVSVTLLIYAGYTILTITEPLIDGIETIIENALGFLAFLIDVSSILSLSLGNGYWLTIIMLGCLFSIKTFLLIKNKHTQGKGA